MAPKKKRKKKPNGRAAKKLRRTIGKAGVPEKSGRGSKKSAKKRSVQKRAAARPKARTRKKPSVSAETEVKREFRSRNRTAAGARSAQPSADFKGVSRRQQADSESVDELVEEGNLFEAGAVAGVEKADDADEREVQTQELPEDDVPEEYLDKE